MIKNNHTGVGSLRARILQLFCAVFARIRRLRKSLQYFTGKNNSLRKFPQFSAKLPQQMLRQT